MATRTRAKRSANAAYAFGGSFGPGIRSFFAPQSSANGGAATPAAQGTGNWGPPPPQIPQVPPSDPLLSLIQRMTMQLSQLANAMPGTPEAMQAQSLSAQIDQMRMQWAQQHPEYTGPRDPLGTPQGMFGPGATGPRIASPFTDNSAAFLGQSGAYDIYQDPRSGAQYHVDPRTGNIYDAQGQLFASAPRGSVSPIVDQGPTGSVAPTVDAGAGGAVAPAAYGAVPPAPDASIAPPAAAAPPDVATPPPAAPVTPYVVNDVAPWSPTPAPAPAPPQIYQPPQIFQPPAATVAPVARPVNDVAPFNSGVYTPAPAPTTPTWAPPALNQNLLLALNTAVAPDTYAPPTVPGGGGGGNMLT